jgi:peptidyl-prolyl cis-trans isomerase A (cyclophilin A)
MWTKRETLMKRAILCAAWLALACEPRNEKPKSQNPPAEGNGAAPSASPNPAPPAEPKPAANGGVSLGNGADPENGEFTLEEAVAGLSGSGTLLATIETSMGTIKCSLLPDIAPNTVANFVGLARGTRPFYDFGASEWVKRPFYDGLTFHRVIPDFMIQGGDPRGNGTGNGGFQIQDEFTDKKLFDRPGRLAMAHSPRPNSAGTQFFITETAYDSLDKKYAIFGECENIDVVRQIARVPKLGGRGERPADPIYIKHIEISYK